MSVVKERCPGTFYPSNSYSSSSDTGKDRVVWRWRDQLTEQNTNNVLWIFQCLIRQEMWSKFFHSWGIWNMSWGGGLWFLIKGKPMSQAFLSWKPRQTHHRAQLSTGAVVVVPWGKPMWGRLKHSPTLRGERNSVRNSLVSPKDREGEMGEEVLQVPWQGSPAAPGGDKLGKRSSKERLLCTYCNALPALEGLWSSLYCRSITYGDKEVRWSSPRRFSSYFPPLSCWGGWVRESLGAPTAKVNSPQDKIHCSGLIWDESSYNSLQRGV